MHHPLTLIGIVTSTSAVSCAPAIFTSFSTFPSPTEIYTLSLHDALPIYLHAVLHARRGKGGAGRGRVLPGREGRSEEHTSELQSRQYLVCRLLLEKKKKSKNTQSL